MKTSSPLSLIATFALFILILFSALNVRAQCPTDIPPTTGPGSTWSTGTPITYTIPGSSGCQIKIYFCIRRFGTPQKTQIYFYKVEKLTSACDPIPPEQLIDIAIDYLFKNAAAGPPCNDTTETFEIFRARCWGIENYTGYPPEQPAFNGCSVEGAYCGKRCEVCYENGHNTLKDCTYITYGSTPDCLALGADGDTWLLGHCYLIDCGDE